MGRGRYFGEVQNAIVVWRTNGDGSRYQEPHLESACLDHGYVKSFNFEVVTRWEQLAAVGPRSGFSWVS